MKLIVALSIVFTSYFSFSQDVLTKDGVSMGKRSTFMELCTSGVDDRVMDIKGVKIEAKKYCSCVVDNLVPTLHSAEIMAAYEEGKMVDLFLNDKNLPIIMECTEGNYTYSDEFNFGDVNSPEAIKIGVMACLEEFKKDEEAMALFTEEMAESYCSCAVEKLMAKGITYGDLQKLGDVDGEAFNEIVMPCVTEAMGINYATDPPLEFDEDFEEITGGGVSSEVPLVDYMGQGYKLKINLGGVEKYFLFDTGASDLVIDSATEKELLKGNIIDEGNYIDTEVYILANNQEVEAQVIWMDEVSIGDYTVSDVEVAIFEEGSLLCGKSFLDRFSKWEVDKKNKVLILYK